MNPINLDHHATTPVLPEVWEAMRPHWSESFGNPASAHAFGRRARRALEDAREQIASLLGAEADEVIFTSGATEANNLALFGLAGKPPGHILASPIEHPCVIEPLKQLAARGFDVEWLPVGSDGAVRADDVKTLIRCDTRLIALMTVNHETGALQPVAACAGLSPALLHTDAAQAVGKLAVAGFHALGATSLSASGHKFGAPGGIGLLLLRRGAAVHPLLFGGHQQQGRRPGTEPVALAIGLAKALELAYARMTETIDKVRNLRSSFLAQLQEHVALTINSPEGASPYVANVSFPGCRADLLLMKLDMLGIACSTGSACSSGSLLPSPVLQAMGLADDILRSAMRFSFAAGLSIDDVNEAARRIIICVNDLRRKNI